MRVFVTPCTAPDFDAVAVTLRDSGHTASGRARDGDLLHTLELDTHTLYGSDVVVALPGWRDCPGSTTDVLTEDGAGIPCGSLDDAMAIHPASTGSDTPPPHQQQPRLLLRA